MADNASIFDRNIEKKTDPILAALDKRVKSARITMLVFIYLIFTAMTLVFIGVAMMKSRNENPFQTFANMIYNPEEKEAIKFNIDSMLQGKTHNNKILESSQDEFEKMVQEVDIRSRIMNSYQDKKSTSQEIAESIASIAISLTLLIFVGFVMKASIMFIKYHMQIGNDYDNQKIAYLLSKGKVDLFGKTLNELRTHNITFDKTPSLPQEKIIHDLIAALNIAKKKE